MYEYFNPSRPSHIELLKLLEVALPNKKELEMYKYGNRTQHIFRKGKYVMTIDWSLV